MHPDKPSIAVLPFVNLTGDPHKDYFSDGLTINFITQLYKIPNLFVIAHQSSFKYKGKALKIQQLGRELGVRYVLEGGVQISGHRIRINAQLIDTQTGDHIWAERYDRELKDVFALQDEIIRKAVTEMAVKVSWGEDIRWVTSATEDFEALDYYFKSYELFVRFEKESNAQARRFLEKAIELDPKYALAIAFLGYTHLMDARLKWVKSPRLSVEQAEELAHRAVAIDDCLVLAHQLLGSVYMHKGLYDKALAAKERAIVCEPNNAVAINSLANALNYAGRQMEALKYSRKAMRLYPHPPYHLLFTAGRTNYFAEQYEAAITEWLKIIERFPGSRAQENWPWLIASYMELGREKEARSEVQKLLEQRPDMSIEAHVKKLKNQPFKDFLFLDHHVELLRKAGLK
ncbi:hypothetical protein LCGC14_1950740 [marine sediment metagenome]|uniref:Uncharacterized protein n=1 Tax=marine sediment metagenome TaxID=412755 RepID=A0A0F9G5X9_9ZZZZ